MADNREREREMARLMLRADAPGFAGLVDEMRKEQQRLLRHYARRRRRARRAEARARPRRGAARS
jgi:hypothetical protein